MSSNNNNFIQGLSALKQKEITSLRRFLAPYSRIQPIVPFPDFRFPHAIHYENITTSTNKTAWPLPKNCKLWEPDYGRLYNPCLHDEAVRSILTFVEFAEPIGDCLGFLAFLDDLEV